MKIQKDKLMLLFFYLLFGLLSLAFFLVLTFPFDLMEKQVLRQLAAKTECVVTIKESHYRFPAKATWQGIQSICPKRVFGLQETGLLTLQFKSLTAGLALIPLLLKQEAQIRFELESKLGNVPGTLTLLEKDEQLTFFLKTNEAKLKIEEAGLSGGLSFESESEWTDQDILKGTGKVSFSIENGRFKEFNGTALPIGEVTFSSITGQFFWTEGRAVIEAFSAQGDMADIESENGILLLRMPPENSLLTLSLSAMPKGALKEMAGLFIQGYNGRDALKLRVNGPVRAPKLSLNGKTVTLGF